MDPDENFFEEESTTAAKKPSVVPWVLFVTVLVLSAGGGYMGYRELRNANASLVSARKDAEETRARLTEADQAKKALEARVAALAEENGRLTAERDGLTQKLRDTAPPSTKTKASSVKMTKSKLRSWKKIAKRTRH